MPGTDHHKTKRPLLDTSRRITSCYFYTLLELLATRITFFEHLLMTWRTPVFTQEVDALHLTPSDKVLHLGCGSLPTASLLIAKKTQTKTIVGIDNNMIAVRLARGFIKRKHLTNTITIEYGNGAAFPIHDFDVIFIAINVWPLDAVLRHLATTMKPTARILCKGSHDDVTTMLATPEFTRLFTIDTVLRHQNSQSIILSRKP
jgi:ribosomal protein L11 methylase PrmA